MPQWVTWVRDHGGNPVRKSFTSPAGVSIAFATRADESDAEITPRIVIIDRGVPVTTIWEGALTYRDVRVRVAREANSTYFVVEVWLNWGQRAIGAAGLAFEALREAPTDGLVVEVATPDDVALKLRRHVKVLTRLLGEWSRALEREGGINRIFGALDLDRVLIGSVEPRSTDEDARALLEERGLAKLVEEGLDPRAAMARIEAERADGAK